MAGVDEQQLPTTWKRVSQICTAGETVQKPDVARTPRPHHEHQFVHGYAGETPALLPQGTLYRVLGQSPASCRAGYEKICRGDQPAAAECRLKPALDT
jgi:hypothetical protein